MLARISEKKRASRVVSLPCLCLSWLYAKGRWGLIHPDPVDYFSMLRASHKQVCPPMPLLRTLFAFSTSCVLNVVWPSLRLPPPSDLPGLALLFLETRRILTGSAPGMTSQFHTGIVFEPARRRSVGRKRIVRLSSIFIVTRFCSMKNPQRSHLESIDSPKAVEVLPKSLIRYEWKRLGRAKSRTETPPAACVGAAA